MSDKLDYLIGISIVGVIIRVIVNVIVSITLANYLGVTGIVWWAFAILFYLIINRMLNGYYND